MNRPTNSYDASANDAASHANFSDAPRGPAYLKVFLTFARNSLIRDMTFRTNFILQCISSTSWAFMNIGFYELIFSHTHSIGADTGWGKDEFYVFLATTWLINSLVQAFFMPNVQEFSELIRTGNLDFALLKPIDTQFLISFNKVDWSSLSNFGVGLLLLVYAALQLSERPISPIDFGVVTIALYFFYLLCGVAILYSLMIALAATSIWLGRNQSLYNFWFYITNFSRYPMEIYKTGYGLPLYYTFTFVVPVLIVVNIPAKVMAQPVATTPESIVPLAVFAIFATLGSLLASRWVFKRALLSYRSASS
ncbi:MAG: ABC-2 type transport system permease protein [Pirellulaceae bacterium]|jgi:ABC-2 type transport system permease protein